MKRKNDGEAQSAQGPAEKPTVTTRRPLVLAAARKRERTKRELERREIQDWAAISRTQVYYSLEKLERAGLLRKLKSEEPASRPERDTFETTEKGREALADTLEREEWTTQRERPAFLTWLALSWLARPGVFRKQLKKRRKFLLKELEREKKTILSIYAEVGHKFHEAAWMVNLMILQLKTEILWNRRLERELKRRAAAL